MLEIITHKKCSKCKIEKDVREFRKNKSKLDGLQSECVKCAKEYREKNKEKTREYVEKNKEYNEKIREYMKQYYKKNKIKFKRKNQTYMKNYMDEYYKKNKIKIRERNRKYATEYRKTEKGKISIINVMHKRRCIKKQGDMTTTQLLRLRQNAKVCYWCGVSLKKVKVHIDHYVPLSKGGLHTMSNLVVSCGKCNQIKSAKDPIKFANSIGKLL